MPVSREERKIYSVSELTRLLDSELMRSFGDIWVEGEVGSYSKGPSGHVYFRLKDDESLLKVAIFKQHALRMLFQVENGTLLLVRGRLGLYGKSGELQFYGSYAEPFGIGAMKIALEQAKKKLRAEGLTDPGKKRKIPIFPKKIGIVTSLEGAAIRDIISILKKREAPFEVVVSPTLVQGNEAPQKIKNALEKLRALKNIGLIIITRGGGSFEDLNAFNDESLARSIASSPVPVISAVGHEIDFVLTDLTADLRAPTPTAAAEIVCLPLISAREKLLNVVRSAHRSLSNRLSLVDEKLALFTESRALPLFSRRLEVLEERRDRALKRIAEKEMEKLENCKRRLDYLELMLNPKKLFSTVSLQLQKIMAAEKEISLKIGSGLHSKSERLKHLFSMISARNPLEVLSKGYSVLKDRQGRAVRTASQVETGEKLPLLLYDGKLKIIVEDKE